MKRCWSIVFVIALVEVFLCRGRLAAEDDTPPDSKPAPPEISMKSVAIIETGDGTGTGFIFEKAGRKFLATNIHVIAGAAHRDLSCSTVGGTRIHLPTVLILAEDRDLAILPIDYNGPAYQIVENFEDAVSYNDEIVVIGNEAGATVATRISGVVTGIGPERVETDARFVEGNSGSPLLHVPTGKVIGIATYYIEYDIPEADREFTKEEEGENEDGSAAESEDSEESGKKRRRFAERLDNVERWARSDIATLADEAKSLDEYRDYLEGVASVASYISQTRQVPPSTFATPVIGRELAEFHEHFNATRRSGSEANNRAVERLRKDLLTRLRAIRSQTERSLSIAYLQNEFERSTAFEELLAEYFEALRAY